MTNPRPIESGSNEGRPRSTFTDQAKAEFLEELAILGVPTAAAAAAGIPSSVARWHRDRDPEFAEQWRQALERCDRMLMKQLRTMAVNGIVTRVIRNEHGVIVHEERRYSEKLLLAWLRRQESGSWRDHVTVDQNVTGKVEHEHTGRIEVEQLTPEQRRKAREFLASLN